MTEARIQLAAKVLRWQHWTGAQIAAALGISAATAIRILRRSWLNRRRRLSRLA
jgi:putative ATPase subunit gpP of terminase